MRIIDLAKALCLALGLTPACTLAATHGLVVGVSDYAAYEPYAGSASIGTSYDLQGAANDAKRIARAMRARGISLPDDRLLIDAEATRAGFLSAWHTMLDEAQPGDTLIVTFAGHGGQEREVAEPFDEPDNRDEMIMFHDFDPEVPGIGRLNDDELNALFRDAAAYELIWVADSCHSGGLKRSAGRTLSRFGGLFEGLPDPGLAAAPLGEGDGGRKDTSDSGLSHVTQILATASEDFLVEEIEIDGTMHGALSWYFAEALEGAADADGDGVTTRAELSAFLDVRVFTHMNQTQQPRILPRGDSRALIGGGPKADKAPRPEVPLAVTVIGAPPPGLDTSKVRHVELGAALVFEALAPGQWEVRNGTGDRVTEIDTTGNPAAALYGLPQSAEGIVRRSEMLLKLTELSATDPDAPRLRLASGGDLMKLGDRITMRYTGDAAALPYLTLFNLASTGEVQFLHPGPGPGTGELSASIFEIAFDVVRPVGADSVVALACPTPPRDLWDVLSTLDGEVVAPELFMAISNSACAVTMTGVYTAE